MNYGILHNRRPTKGDAPNPLLQDPRMREMAKQLGLEPKDFGKEAVELWKTLDAMAENDPSAYQNFINDQLKDGPPPSNEGGQAAAPTPVRAFNPKPGYVVKCTMMGSVKQKVTELKLFLNLCFHEIIDLPKNPNSGRPVPRDSHAVPTTNNLEIPLVIGALRELKDFNGAACRAIDVVFHPWVHDRCEWDTKFKRDIMSLAITCVQQDAKITLVSPVGKFIKSVYKGGVTVGNEVITARFPIEPEQQQTRTLDVKLYDDENQEDNSINSGTVELKTERPTPPPPVEKIAMATPSDLLKKMNVSDTDDRRSEFLIAPADSQKATESKPAKAGVVEHAAPTKTLIEVIEPKQEATRKPAVKKSPAVKRGFLNTTKKPLYPSGSSEGRPASAYVNLLSRSKVVDLGVVDQQKKTQQEEAEQRRAELEATLGVLKQPVAPPTPDRPDVNQDEQDHGDFEFEQLCMEADPDLKPSNARGADPATHAMFGEHLDEFAKFLSSQS